MPIKIRTISQGTPAKIAEPAKLMEKTASKKEEVVVENPFPARKEAMKSLINLSSQLDFLGELKFADQIDKIMKKIGSEWNQPHSQVGEGFSLDHAGDVAGQDKIERAYRDVERIGQVCNNLSMYLKKIPNPQVVSFVAKLNEFVAAAKNPNLRGEVLEDFKLIKNFVNYHTQNTEQVRAVLNGNTWGYFNGTGPWETAFSMAVKLRVELSQRYANLWTWDLDAQDPSKGNPDSTNKPNKPRPPAWNNKLNGGSVIQLQTNLGFHAKGNDHTPQGKTHNVIDGRFGNTTLNAFITYMGGNIPARLKSFMNWTQKDLDWALQQVVNTPTSGDQYSTQQMNQYRPSTEDLPQPMDEHVKTVQEVRPLPPASASIKPPFGRG